MTVYLSVLLKGLIPLLYTLFVGSAFAILLRRGIAEAIAPAFCTQIILMMITGMTIDSVYAGLYVMLAISVLIWVLALIRHNVPGVKVTDCALISIVYLGIWIINYDKRFDYWDEFSHWGRAVKEIYRLDELFCHSPLQWQFKHYLPAASIFEALWCKLMLGYSEDNAYRGIQFLQASMLIPAVIPGKARSSWLARFAGLMAVFILPLLFELPFYHTLCVDLLMGCVWFYCMWLIISGADDISSIISLVLALIVLVQIKVTAITFLPMIVIFYFVYRYHGLVRSLTETVVLTLLPTAMWKIYNTYMRSYVPTNGDYQTYEHYDMSLIKHILLHDGAIPWQKAFEAKYTMHLFTEPVLSIVPYAVAVILMSVVLIMLAHGFIDDMVTRRQIRLIALWIILAGVAYALLMWFLYQTAFDEFGAMNMNSYFRYMSTYMLTAALLTLSTVLNYSDRNPVIIGASGVVIVMALVSAVARDGIDQIFPGNIQFGNIVKRDVMMSEQYVDYLSENLPEDCNLYIVARGNPAYDIMFMSYYLMPMQVNGASPGPQMFEGDSESRDYSIEEFVDQVSSSDYIYFRYYDDVFYDKYKSAFDHPEWIRQQALYSIDVSDGVVHLLEQQGDLLVE